jgi:hypothetical protein
MATATSSGAAALAEPIEGRTHDDERGVMETSLRFPRRADVTRDRALEFRALSPEGQSQWVLELVEMGEMTLDNSPRREAILRHAERQKEQWRNIQKELFQQYERRR